MAYIEQKINATGVEQMTILLPQETFYVPFLSQLGGDWNELRISIYISYCGASTTTFNNTYTEESITNTNLSQFGWYFGIGNFSGNSLIPYNSGANFVGGTNYFPSTSASIIPAGSVNGLINNMGFLVTNNNLSSGTNSNNFPNNNINIPPSNNTGNSNYCIPLTIGFKITNKGQVGQKILPYSASTDTAVSIADITSLRLNGINLPNSGSLNNSNSFYYTTGLLPNGGPLSIPDTVLLHSPFFNSYMRIHNIVVEKFN